MNYTVINYIIQRYLLRITRNKGNAKDLILQGQQIYIRYQNMLQMQLLLLMIQYKFQTFTYIIYISDIILLKQVSHYLQPITFSTIKFYISQDIMIGLKFLIALFFTLPKIFWIAVVLPFVAYYQAWKIGEGKKVHQFWSSSVSDFLKVKYQNIGKETLTEEPVIYLCNHRTQADFFISDCVTKYRANILSRKQVAYVFPMAWLINPGSIWFFNRNNVQIEKFNGWINGYVYKFSKKILNNISRGASNVQILVSKISENRHDKIQLCNQKTDPDDNNLWQLVSIQLKGDEVEFWVDWCQNRKKIYYGYSEVIDPRQYGTQQQYVSYVSQSFRSFFSENYGIYLKKVEEDTQLNFKVS